MPGKAKSVKRFKRSNGLDTALYKNYLYLYLLMLSSARDCHIGFIFYEIEKGTGPPSTSGYVDGHIVQRYVYHKHRKSYSHVNDFMKSRRPYWILKNATGRNFAHPPENVVLDHYELISIDRKSLYNNSTVLFDQYYS